MNLRNLLRIDAENPTPVYAQIEEQLARLILSGAYGPGDRLPSVRELAALLRVNPLTVSRTYARLAGRGLVRRVRGKGVFISENPPSLSKREREEVLAENIDRLLEEARRLNFPREEILALLKKRASRFES